MFLIRKGEENKVIYQKKVLLYILYLQLINDPMDYMTSYSFKFFAMSMLIGSGAPSRNISSSLSLLAGRTTVM